MDRHAEAGVGTTTLLSTALVLSHLWAYSNVFRKPLTGLLLRAL